MDIQLSAIVGSKESITAELQQRFTYMAHVSTEMCYQHATDIVKQRATRYLRDMIRPALDMAYLELTIAAGEPSQDWPFVRKEEWSSAMDDKLEAVIEPYEHILSSDWTARYTIASRLHEPGGLEAWADEFAGEVYRNITYLHKHAQEGAPKTAAQIMSSVGIVEDDFNTFLATRPRPTIQQQEEHRMQTLQETLAKLHGFNQLTGAKAAEVMSLLDNARDSDDGLALSGITGLGGDMNDVVNLRGCALTNEALAQCIITGAYQGGSPTQVLSAAPQPVAQPVAPAVMDDLSQFMGGGAVAVEQAQPVVHPYSQTGALLDAATAAEDAAAPPPPAKRSRGGTPPTGAIPALVFQALKDHTGVKSEDIGAGLGVSRGTFENYAKGKAHYVPTKEGLDFLHNLFTTKMNALRAAYASLPPSLSQ